MSFELRASDNRVSGLSAELAIDGATRHVNYVLATQVSYGSNGMFPAPAGYLSEAVPVDDAHFWLIGRDTNATTAGPGQLSFGLVDEAAKLNLNTASSNLLAGLLIALPRANPDLASAILDWRDTNSTGAYQTYYATRPQPYQCKSAPFETVEELRLLYGADMDTLAGEDLNRNGVLDVNENDENHNGVLEPGVLDYVTVYSREPNTYSNGTARVNIRVVTATGPLPTLLQNALGSARANVILGSLGLLTPSPTGRGPGGGGRPGVRGGPAGGGTVILSFTSPLHFYRASKMTADEFAKIANALTVTNGAYINGRINVNTASATVLGALPGLSSNPGLGQTLVTYRQSNPDKLGSIAWVVDALGDSNSSVLGALEATDCITTQTFQLSADVAALGPNGRGYRRIRFIFDTSEGTPKIIYRQDLTHLGWALGKEVRDAWLLAKATR